MNDAPRSSATATEFLAPDGKPRPSGREGCHFGGSSEPVEFCRRAMAEAFPHHTRYIIPYRGFAPNRGQGLVLGEETIKADAVRAHAYVARQHSNIYVLGRSLGTGVACTWQLDAR